MVQRRLLAPEKIVGSAKFEEACASFPKRDRGEPKRAVLRAWNATMKRSGDEAAMAQASRDYADYCRRRGIEGTPYVMRAATFYGPDEHWRESFSRPQAPTPIRRAPAVTAPEERLDPQEAKQWVDQLLTGLVERKRISRR